MQTAAINGNQNKDGEIVKAVKYVIIVIIALWLIGTIFGGGSSKPRTYKDTVRCGYCGKVIRSEGRNIHGTPLYNGGTLKCDYCGHKTNIY